MNKNSQSSSNSAPASASRSAQFFIIIYHHWWMDSGSFEEEIYESKSREDAEQYAAAKCHRKAYTFQHWDYHIVKAVTK